MNTIVLSEEYGKSCGLRSLKPVALQVRPREASGTDGFSTGWVDGRTAAVRKIVDPAVDAILDKWYSLANATEVGEMMRAGSNESAWDGLSPTEREQCIAEIAQKCRHYEHRTPVSTGRDPQRSASNHS